MTDVVVIGYGNTLLSDDGAGHAVLDHLTRHLGLSGVSGVDLMKCHQLTPELAETVAGRRLAVFVDARTGQTPGQVEVSEIQPTAAELESAVFSHSTDPVVIASMIRRLYGKAPRICLVTIGGENFQEGEALSERVERAVPEAAGAVLRLIEEVQKEKSHA